jgi:hypothetical protein
MVVLDETSCVRGIQTGATIAHDAVAGAHARFASSARRRRRRYCVTTRHEPDSARDRVLMSSFMSQSRPASSNFIASSAGLV